QRSRSSETGLAGAVLAQPRACGSSACVGCVVRRADFGTDVGGATADRRATAHGGSRTQSGVDKGRARTRRHRDQGGDTAIHRSDEGRSFSQSCAMSTESKDQLAVALHYDRSGAPRVVAKGRGSIGARIVEIARAHGIPIEENEVLAGALSNVELGDEIPAELYRAVAEVLIFVLRLSRRIGWTLIPFPPIFPPFSPP